MAVFQCAVSHAQPAFRWQGGEYPVIGAVPGDQTYPAVAIGPEGGWLVWQENGNHPTSFAIAAQRLDASFSGAFGRFQLSSSEGSHELPKVALLGAGGAVVVWQRQQGSDTDIVARFLRADGTFAGNEAVVNTHRSGDQRGPAVAALADGGAVVVWASDGQDGSRFGVYAQRFDGNGVRLGEEFRVNQATASNQKEPAVSALADGGFVVAWVSEQQRHAVSVDVQARLFAADGAAGAEFRLNGMDVMAMTPAVSGRAGGGFVAAWTQIHTEASTDGRDIQFVVYNAGGQAQGVPQRLNQHAYGDQFSPRITPSGMEHVIVWTSLGQDGDQEGVFGRFLNSNGETEGDEMRINSTTGRGQIHPAIGADGYGRMLAVWAGFQVPAEVASTTPNNPPPSQFDLLAQRFDALRPVPTPAAPHVHALSSDSLSVSWPPLLGFFVAAYEVHVNGSAAPLSTESPGVVIPGLAAGSEHSVRLSYVLTDGRRSALSPPAVFRTWGEDANGDGIPDEWQKLFFGKSATQWPSPDVDSDGDGASDRAEFLAGTNPQDPTSVLRSELASVGESLRFGWSTQPGMVYQVQRSTHMLAWENVGPPRFAAGGADSVPIDRSGTAGFYRVIRVR
jgi:hypothetical protein